MVGGGESEWQETKFVLRHFDKRMSVARQKYEEFVADGLAQGRQPLLTGGGLVRSAGGWKELIALRRADITMHSDERILGAVKIPGRVQARSLLCCWAVRELGLTAALVASRLGITPSAVSRLAQRGEKLARENGHMLETD